MGRLARATARADTALPRAPTGQETQALMRLGSALCCGRQTAWQPLANFVKRPPDMRLPTLRCDKAVFGVFGVMGKPASTVNSAEFWQIRPDAVDGFEPRLSCAQQRCLQWSLYETRWNRSPQNPVLRLPRPEPSPAGGLGR